VGAEFFHADGQTGGRTNIKKLIVDFCNFAYAPTNLTTIPENRTPVPWLFSVWPNSPYLPRYPGQRDCILQPQLIDQLSVTLCGFINILRTVCQVGYRYRSHYYDVQYPKPN